MKAKRIKSKPFTTVTPFSKTLALVLFIALPVLAFLYGYNRGFAVQDAACRATELTMLFR